MYKRLLLVPIQLLAVSVCAYLTPPPYEPIQPQVPYEVGITAKPFGSDVMNPVYRKFGAWRPHNNAWKPNYATTNPPFTKSSGDHGQAWRPRNNAWKPNYATTTPPNINDAIRVLPFNQNAMATDQAWSPPLLPPPKEFFTKSSGDRGQAWRPPNNAWKPNYATTNPPVVINPLPTSPPDTLSGVAELRALFENKKNEQWQGKPSYTPFTNTYGKPSTAVQPFNQNAMATDQAWSPPLLPPPKEFFTKSSGDHGQAWRPRNNAWEPNYATTNPPVVINPLPTSPPDTLSGVAELRALFENKKNEQWQGKPSYTPFTNTYGKPSYKLEYDDDNGRRHWGRGLDKTERVEVYESPVYNTFQEYRQRHN